MKYLKKYSQINEMEKWVERAMKSLKYEREEDIRMYLVELLDMGWVETKTRYDMGDENFVLKSRIHYMKNPVYLQYNFEFSNTKVLTMDRSIELLEVITTAVERLKDDGYIFKILNFAIGKEQSSHFKLSIFHKDDVVPWENIFTI